MLARRICLGEQLDIDLHAAIFARSVTAEARACTIHTRCAEARGASLARYATRRDQETRTSQPLHLEARERLWDFVRAWLTLRGEVQTRRTIDRLVAATKRRAGPVFPFLSPSASTLGLTQSAYRTHAQQETTTE